MTPEQEAVIVAYRQYRNYLIGTASPIAGADAEDIVHDAVLKAVASAGACRGDVLPWLVSIVHNTAVSAWRRRATAGKYAPALVSAPVHDHAEDVARTVDAEREAALMMRAVAGLPRRQRQAVMALARHGQYEKAAVSLGMSLGTYKIHLARARRECRAQASGAAAPKARHCPDCGYLLTAPGHTVECGELEAA